MSAQPALFPALSLRPGGSNAVDRLRHPGAKSPTTAGAGLYWPECPALMVGTAAALLAGVMHSSPPATCFTVGLGGFIAVLALWSLLATDPTIDHLKIATTGLALFIAPWVAGFTADRGAWTAWVAGFIVTALGVAGYLRGEALDYPRLVRDEAVAAYQRRFPHSGLSLRSPCA